MTTTFNVIDLGVAADIDTVEANLVSENADVLVGVTFGSSGSPLYDNVVQMSEGDNGLPLGVSLDVYEQSGLVSANFSIDGGADQQLDGIAVYDCTVTYADGTTAVATLTVFQDADGNCYLAPPVTLDATATLLVEKSIQSITIDGVVDDGVGVLVAARVDLDFKKVCFTPGTPILTPAGERAVETLREGDLVCTPSGALPVRWIGGSRVPARGRAAPVRVRAGSLAPGLPTRDLLVSPQHRLLLRSPVARRMFGSPEVLVAAKALRGLPGIAAEEGGAVTYLHLLLDRHEIVTAAGAQTESLLTGPMTLRALGPRVEADLRRRLPGVIERAAVPARPIAQGAKAARLIERIGRNGKPLVEPAGEGGAARAA